MLLMLPATLLDHGIDQTRSLEKYTTIKLVLEVVSKSPLDLELIQAYHKRLKSTLM